MTTKAASSTIMVADAANLNAVSGAGIRQESAGTCNAFTVVPTYETTLSNNTIFIYFSYSSGKRVKLTATT